MQKNPVNVPPQSDSGQLLLLRAATLYQTGKFTEAAALYSKVTAAMPEYVAARYQLAMIELKLGREQDAVEHFKAVVAIDPKAFIAYYNLGFAYQKLGRLQEAVDAYKQARSLEPDDIQTLFGLAAAFAYLGRLNEATESYRTLVRIPAARLQALIRLAILDPDAVSSDELTWLQQATQTTSNTDTRIALQFALGELLERRQKFDDAFTAFAIGNRLKRDTLIGASSPEEIARSHATLVATIKSRFTAGFLNEHAGSGDDSIAPIFIVGMPRSGSTLIEQILSSHPDVQGLGELPTFVSVIERAYPYDPKAPQGRGTLKIFADRYLKRMRAAGWKEAPRFVDKMLDNYLHVGMIHLLFPKAVILHSVRNPIDTCFACYRQLFTGAGNESTYDLRDIAGEYARYREMMAHWDAVLPGRVLNVEYEALIGDPDAMIRRLVTESCGLPWDDACLAFYAAQQPVSTASAVQVRQPIFKRSAFRWRKYEHRLGELIEALGKQGID